MENKKKKLYIGCALTNLADEARSKLLSNIEMAKNELRNDFDILEFKGMADLETDNPLTPRDIYDFDLKGCVMSADCMLAICDYPSLGLGYELATSIERLGIPVLAVAHKNSIVTRMIIGIDHPKYEFYRYASFEDIVLKTRELLTK